MLQLTIPDNNYKYFKQLKRGIEKVLQRLDYIQYEQVIKEVNRAKYKEMYQSDIKCDFSYSDAINIENALKDNPSYKRALRQTHNRKNQKHRLNKRIKSILFTMYNSIYNSPDIYRAFFVTLTFDNDILESTNKATRRTYIARFLKEYTYYYIANIDYGKENNREHYHAIVLLDTKQYDNLKRYRGETYNHKLYTKGYNTFKLITIPQLLFLEGEAKYQIDSMIKEDRSSLKIASYINKLTNHGYKENTGDRLIYARNKGDFLVKNYYAKQDNKNNVVVERIRKAFPDVEVE